MRTRQTTQRRRLCEYEQDGCESMSVVPEHPGCHVHSPLTDGFGRVIDHLRLSLIDWCNLACRYCTAENVSPSAHRIEADFAFALVRWLSVQHGFHHIRLTGGEPLLYPDLVPLIVRLRSLPTLDEITLTTNAQVLEHKAQALRESGLSRVNISLDTLDAQRFARITGGGNVVHTLRGIEAALEADLSPVRINVVVQRGFNEHEICELASWGLARGCVVRFLEVMPVGPLAHLAEQHLVPAAEIIERLSDRFALRAIPRPLGQPATDYAIQGAGLSGVVGVISSTTRPFCESCQRIRVTAQGQLLTCLFDRQGVSLREAWNGQSLDEAKASMILTEAVASKPQEGQRCQPKPMAQIGG